MSDDTSRAASTGPPKQPEELHDDAKDRLLAAFSELLPGLWSFLISLIGEEATPVVFQRALREACLHCPLLWKMEVSASESRVDRLWADLGNVDYAELRDGLVAFVESLIDLMTDLIGEALMRKGQLLVQQFRQRMED